MKKSFLLVIPIFLSLFAQSMAAPAGWVDPYANIERNGFVAKKGEWHKARNWTNNKIPEGFVRAYITEGSICTVSAPVNITDRLFVGTAEDKPDARYKPGVLYIEKNAHITMPRIIVPHGTQLNAKGEVYMRDGQLSLQDKAGVAGLLMVGTGSTVSGTALFEISGGKFQGGMEVGSVLPNTQTGTVRVVGSNPTISTFEEGHRNLTLADSGTLSFILDKDGVATLDYTHGALLGQNGKITVDASQYTGGTRRMILIKADRFAYEPSVEIANVSAGYQAKTQFEKKKDKTQLILVMTRKSGAN